MKKNIIIIILGILLLSISALSFVFYKEIHKENIELEEQIEELRNQNENYEKALESRIETVNNEAESSSSQEYSHIILIDYNTFMEKITQKESFILTVTQTTCSHCHEFKPILNKVMKENNLIAYELDLLTLTQEELNKVKDFINISGTPTTLFYENGEENITNRLVGNVSEETIIKRLKETNYIR